MIHSSGKVARLSDFGQHDEKDDDREKFFAGGSEHRFITIVTVIMVTMVI